MGSFGIRNDDIRVPRVMAVLSRRVTLPAGEHPALLAQELIGAAEGYEGQYSHFEDDGPLPHPPATAAAVTREPRNRQADTITVPDAGSNVATCPCARDDNARHHRSRLTRVWVHDRCTKPAPGAVLVTGDDRTAVEVERMIAL